MMQVVAFNQIANTYRTVGGIIDKTCEICGKFNK